MQNKFNLADKIMDLPFGVVFACIFIAAIVGVTIFAVLATVLKLNASMLLVIALGLFAVVRLIYFGITHK